MHSNQARKAEIFRALHQRPGCFVVANAWDAGTARILASLGFEALATTSAGCAFSMGRADGSGAVSPEETLENARQIVEATDLPVSADLENGWSVDPGGVVEVIRSAAAVGLVGGSIEDSTADPVQPIFPVELAVERIRAAAEVARALPFAFTLTARAENFLHGRPDLADTIDRLQRFGEAGADVLYAPGLRSLADIATVVASVDRPVNVVMGLDGCAATVQELAGVGVSRISVGSSFARAALGELQRAATEVLERGSFTYASRALGHGHLNSLFRNWPS